MSDRVSGALLFLAFIFGSFFVYRHFFYKDPNSLWVGISADYKPFAYKDRNFFKGFDVRLCELIGEKLHKTIVFKEGPFSSLIMSLKAGRLDFAISGISPSDDRIEHVDFSSVYFKDTFCMLVKSDSINSLSDLKNEGLPIVIGVQSGTLIEDLANRWRFEFGFKLVSYNINPPIVQALEAGHLGAMFVSQAVGKDIVNNSKKGLRLVPLGNEFYENYAIAFPKNSTLKDAVNKVLQDLMTDVVDSEDGASLTLFDQLLQEYNLVKSAR